MNEIEQKTFKLAYQFYEKWRGTMIETDEQWQEFSADVGQFAIDADIDHNILGRYILVALTDTFNDLYKGGLKPVPNNYFGREDLT